MTIIAQVAGKGKRLKLDWANLQRKIPGTKAGRIALGSALVLGGILGFLPILGFWMIPLGLVILSVDFPRIRQFRRRWTVKIGRKWSKWRAGN